MKQIILLLLLFPLLLARPSQAAGFDHAPPATIRVKHNAARNNCRPGVPDGRIDTIPFEEYVARVVPHEMPPSWPADALKAQSVAARTYGWRYVLLDPNAAWHVDDSTQFQYMCETRNPQTDAAVAATAGQHLTYGGTLITALFSAENVSPTRQNLFGHAYLSAVDDPVSFGKARNGHGQGLSQWGARRWAERGWRYGEILRHYFTGAALHPSAGDGATLLAVANRPTTPWLRGAAFWLELNAANTSGVEARTYRALGGGGWEVSPWRAGQPVTGGWGQEFTLAGVPELPEGDFRVEARALPDTPPEERPVLFLGLDRTAPSLTVTMEPSGPVGAGVPLSATVTLGSGDGGSGVERLGWSVGRWGQEAETLPGIPVVADPAASGGNALRLDPATSNAGTLTFPPIAAPPGFYRLWVRLRTDAPSSTARVATLRGFDDGTMPLQRAVRYLRAGDFPDTGWTWFYADIDTTGNFTANGGVPGTPSETVTPKVEWLGTQPLEIDTLLLATRPTTLVSSATVTLTPPEPLAGFASDSAGNVAWVRCLAEPIALPPLPPPAGPFRLFLPLVNGGVGSGEYRYECAP